MTTLVCRSRYRKPSLKWKRKAANFEERGVAEAAMIYSNPGSRTLSVESSRATWNSELKIQSWFFSIRKAAEGETVLGPDKGRPTSLRRWRGPFEGDGPERSMALSKASSKWGWWWCETRNFARLRRGTTKPLPEPCDGTKSWNGGNYSTHVVFVCVHRRWAVVGFPPPAGALRNFFTKSFKRKAGFRMTTEEKEGRSRKNPESLKASDLAPHGTFTTDWKAKSWILWGVLPLSPFRPH